MGRQIRHIAMGLLVISKVAYVPVHTDTPPQVCIWFRAGPAAGPWEVTQGSCALTLSSDHLEAVLYDDKHPAFVRMKLSGSIQASKLAAKVELEGTDAGMQDFSGDITANTLLGKVMVLRAGSMVIGIKFGPN